MSELCVRSQSEGDGGRKCRDNNSSSRNNYKSGKRHPGNASGDVLVCVLHMNITDTLSVYEALLSQVSLTPS